MSEPSASGPEPTPGPDATLISSPKVKVPTQSSLSPQERTSSGETKSPAPLSTVVYVGSQLGPYKLVDKLGEGGMGAVYKARHVKLGKFLAMKILPQHVMSRPDALARFEREMLAVGALHHPNVVQAHDAGEINGVHYLSMEYVEGQDLQQLVKARGPMSVVNACKAIRQAAQGLAAAHKLGLVHRDIKPSNLFVTKQTGQIKILDMGLALLSQEEVPAALTSTGQCFGTPDYMAPEQWNDAHSCDARADLYSLGCTLFFLLVGHPPYPTETHRTAANKMKGHVIDPIPGLQTKRSDVPPGLVAIFERLMAKLPEDRFSSADELVEALAPFASSKGAPTQPISRTASDSDPALPIGQGGPPDRTILESRNIGIDVARALLVLYIVAVVHGVYLLNAFTHPIRSIILFEMPCIFVVTGYSYSLLSTRYGRPTTDLSSYLRYCRSRFLRIVAPYLAYACAGLIAHGCLSGMWTSPDLSAILTAAAAWFNPFTAGMGVTYSCLNWHLWFVKVYLCVVVVLPWFTQFERQFRVPLWLLISIYGATLFGLSFLWLPELAQYTCFYLLWAAVGYALDGRIAASRNDCSIICGIAIVVLSMIAFQQSANLDMQAQKFPPTRIFFAFGAVWFSVLLLIASSISQTTVEYLHSSWWLRPFVKSGYSIYLWQGLAFTVAHIVAGRHQLPLFVTWGIAVGLSIVLGSIFGPIERMRFRFRSAGPAQPVAANASDST